MCNHSLTSGKDGKRFIVVLGSREWLTLSDTASLVQTQKTQPGYQPIEKNLLRQNVNRRQGVIDKRVGLSHKSLMICIMDVARGLSNFARSLFLLTPAIVKTISAPPSTVSFPSFPKRILCALQVRTFLH